jgi:hypothetical protein
VEHVARTQAIDLEMGRERATREEGGFSYRNAIVAELDGEIAGSLVGNRLDDPYDSSDLDAVPGAVRPLVKLEAKALGSWYVMCSPRSPSFAAGASPGCFSTSPRPRPWGRELLR